MHDAFAHHASDVYWATVRFIINLSSYPLHQISLLKSNSLTVVDAFLFIGYLCRGRWFYDDSEGKGATVYCHCLLGQPTLWHIAWKPHWRDADLPFHQGYFLPTSQFHQPRCVTPLWFALPAALFIVIHWRRNHNYCHYHHRLCYTINDDNANVIAWRYSKSHTAVRIEAVVASFSVS